MMKMNFPLILDGATGTELQKRGYTGAVCAESWVLEHPEVIREIQQNYVDAGSRAVYAPTFSANRYKLEENGIVGATEQYNRDLASISLSAVRGRALVGGDIAPSGRFLPPMGEEEFDDLVDVYTQQARALAEAGVDYFGVETMMSVADARAAVLAIRSVSDKPVFVTFTCDSNGRTLTGTDVAAALSTFTGMGVTAFGLNCSTGPEEMLKQIRRLSETAQIPLIAKPNAGMPHVKDGCTYYDATPEDFRPYVSAFLDAGVGAIGGCCGTDPDFIRVIAEEVEAWKAAGGRVRNADGSPELTQDDLLPLTTERKLFLLPRDAEYGEVIEPTEELEDDLEDDEDSDAPLTAIRITEEEQLEYFCEMQYAISKPLCLLCEDAELLEKTLRAYQGRALYRGDLSSEVLAPLADRYGLLY